MIRDFQTQKELRTYYDFCILGGGPAGITLALKLAGAGWSVLLAEGGGQSYESRSQTLYEVESTGQDAYVAATRLRFLGGTSNHWTGRCRPFDASDFARESIAGLPGWPIAYTELAGYLPEAMRILDLDESRGFESINPALLGEDFIADAFQFSPPTRFAQKYAQVLESTPGLDVFINCNCVDLQFEPAEGRVASVTLADYSGQRAEVSAGQFVLAMGGIENARQLLNSDSLRAAGVIGEQSLAGRCFMEHLNIALGSFVLAERQSSNPRQYYTSESFVEQHRCGKGNATFMVLDEVKSYGRTAEIKSFFKTLACRMGVADKVAFVSSFNCPGDGEIGTLIEQVPNLNSRLQLLEARDALGMRKVSLHWELSSQDRATIRQIGLEVAKRFAESNLGLVKLNENIYDDSLPLTAGHHAHHMGTTRMGRDASTGVVDSECLVFGSGNLYVAGSSVFATGGACNPTMPILQLALRLADHLDRQRRTGRGES